MSSPTQMLPSSLMMAQAATYAKGQETQSRGETKEEKEKRRLLALQLQQAKQQALQTKAPANERGFLA